MSFIDSVTYKIFTDNIQIQNSYTIRNVSTMGYVLDYIKDQLPGDHPCRKMKRSSMILEWAAHNFLYKLNIQRERTGSVDLNVGESWSHKIGYFFIGILGILFP